VRDDEIRRILTEANPWWRAAAQNSDPIAWMSGHHLLRDRARYDLGYRSPILADLVQQPLSDDLVLLTGPRRVGKSVVLLDLAVKLCERPEIDSRQIIHIPCDGMQARDLRRALTLGRELTRVIDRTDNTKRVWLLDEVSTITGWAAILKAARDGTDFGDDTVVITGSRWLRHDDVAGNLLAGRAGRNPKRRVRHLLPMSFREFLHATRPELTQPDHAHPAELQSIIVAAQLEALRFDIDAYDLGWQEYLSCGGFPRAVAEKVFNGDVSDSYLRDLLAWMQRDVDPDATPESLPLLLEKIATQMSSPLSVRATAEALNVGRSETITHLNRLVATFAAVWCPQHGSDGKAIEGAQTKIYLTDPLLAWLPSRVRAGLQPPEMTVLTEAAIGVALARSVDELDEGRWLAGDTIGYIRTGSGKEVDLGPVGLPTAAGTRLSIPIEGKWIDQGWRAAAQVIEKKYGSGVLATKSILDMSSATWAIPAPLVALLLN